MNNFTKYVLTSLILATGMVISALALSKFYFKMEKARPCACPRNTASRATKC